MFDSWAAIGSNSAEVRARSLLEGDIVAHDPVDEVVLPALRMQGVFRLYKIVHIARQLLRFLAGAFWNDAMACEALAL